MSFTRAIAWNTGVQIAGKTVSTVLGIFIISFMTRYLSPEGFGIYSTANAFLQVFALLLDLGLNVTLIAMLGEHADDQAYQKRCVSAFFTLRLIMAAVVLGLFAPAIAWLSPYPVLIKLSVLVLIASFFFPTLNQIITGVQQQQLKMSLAALGEVMSRVIFLIGILLVKKFEGGLLSLISFVSVGAAVNFFFNYWVMRKRTYLKWNWDPEFWRMTLKRSWPIGVSIAFGLIYFKADTLILSFVRPQAEVGIYSYAYRVLEIFITVPFMYAGVLLPMLSSAWAKHNREYFSRLIGKSLDAMMILIAPLLMGTWILGTRVIVLIAGKEFTSSGDVLHILVLAVAVIYLNTIFSHAVVAIHAQRKMVPIYIAVAFVTLIGYLLFIPTYGMWAAAWLTVFSETAVGLGSLWMIQRSAVLEFKPKVSAVAVFAATLTGSLIWPLRDSWLPLPLLVGSVSYFIILILFGGISKQILREIFSFRKTPMLPPVS